MTSAGAGRDVVEVGPHKASPRPENGQETGPEASDPARAEPELRTKVLVKGAAGDFPAALRPRAASLRAAAMPLTAAPARDPVRDLLAVAPALPLSQVDILDPTPATMSEPLAQHLAMAIDPDWPNPGEGEPASLDGSQSPQPLPTAADRLLSPGAAGTTAFAAGFVWWLTRAGGLMSLIVMGVPAWRHIDLLPVASGLQADDDDEPLAPHPDQDPDPDPDPGSGPGPGGESEQDADVARAGNEGGDTLTASAPPLARPGPQAAQR